MPAYKIIGGDKKEYGPATADEIRQWIAEGRLNGKTLVQVEGRTEWEPLDNLGEFFAALHAQAQIQAELRTPPPISTASPASLNPPINPQVRIAGCFSRSFALLTHQAPVILVSALLVGITGIILQFLPFVGLIYWVIRGVLYGGLSLVYLKAIRGETVSPADAFSGFQRNFAQLMLTGMLTSALANVAMCFCFLPGIYLAVCWTFAIMLAADRNMDFWPAMELSRKTVNRVWFKVFGLLLIAFLPYVLMTIYMELQIFRELWPLLQEVWSASSSPDPAALVQQLSTRMATVLKTAAPLMVASKVVLLFILPFAYGAVMFAYEDLFGPRNPGPR